MDKERANGRRMEIHLSGEKIWGGDALNVQIIWGNLTGKNWQVVQPQWGPGVTPDERYRRYLEDLDRMLAEACPDLATPGYATGETITLLQDGVVVATHVIQRPDPPQSAPDEAPDDAEGASRARP